MHLESLQQNLLIFKIKINKQKYLFITKKEWIVGKNHHFNLKIAASVYP